MLSHPSPSRYIALSFTPFALLCVPLTDILEQASNVYDQKIENIWVEITDVQPNGMCSQISPLHIITPS